MGDALTDGVSRAIRDLRHRRLAAAARDGDAASFRRLYLELFAPISRYLRARVASVADAEDLTSHVFHRLLERLDAFDPARGSVLGWALAIAHNALIDHHRAAGRSVGLADAGPLVHAGADPLESLLRDEKVRRVLVVLHELDPELRGMLALRFEQELRYRDIAALLGIREETVRKRFSRLLRELKSKLTGEDEERSEETPDAL
jgi:RNA polymerase sigma-70 factor (ECF subfamily)